MSGQTGSLILVPSAKAEKRGTARRDWETPGGWGRDATREVGPKHNSEKEVFISQATLWVWRGERRGAWRLRSKKYHQIHTAGKIFSRAVEEEGVARLGTVVGSAFAWRRPRPVRGHGRS